MYYVSKIYKNTNFYLVIIALRKELIAGFKYGAFIYMITNVKLSRLFDTSVLDTV